MGRHRRRWNILKKYSVVWVGLDVTEWQAFVNTGTEVRFTKKKGGGELFQTEKPKCCMITDCQKLCSVCYGGISVVRKITRWGQLLCLCVECMKIIVCVLRQALELRYAQRTYGTQGTYGTHGTNGTRWTHGTQGTYGIQGTHKTMGTCGTHGTYGTHGTNRTQWTNGTQWNTRHTLNTRNTGNTRDIRNTSMPTLLVTKAAREPTVSNVVVTEREVTSDNVDSHSLGI